MLKWPFGGREVELQQLDEWLERGSFRGVVLYGEIGIGKSWLAGRWLEGASSFSPQHTVRCRRALMEVPLGCMAPLLDGDPIEAGTAARLAAIEHAVRDRDGRRSILLVEDAQWIDAATAHLLRRLVLDEATTLLITVCTSAPASRALPDLVKEDVLRSLEVPPLAVDEVAQMLSAALAGPVDPTLVAAVFEVSEGNPLFVRELVTASLDTDAIRLDEVWSLTRQLELSTLLTDLTFDRVGALSDRARETLRIVAEAGSVDLEHLLMLVTPSAVAELELAGLVASYEDGGMSHYRTDHNLVAEIVLAQTPAVERMAIAGRLADALEALGRPGDGPFLDVMRHRLTSFDVPGSDDLVRAQALAMQAHDFALATECGRILWQRRGTPEEALALGDGLYALHTRDSLLELEDVLAECQASMPLDDPRLPELIGLRALNLGVGIGRIEDAADLVHDVISGTPDPAESERLAMALGATLLYCGFPDRALDALSRLDPAVAGPSTLLHTDHPPGELHICNALWMSGRIERLRDRMRSMPDGRREPWMQSTEAATLLYLGDLDQAGVMANEALTDVFVAAGDDMFTHLQAHLALGWLNLMQGRSREAAADFETAAGAVEGMALAIVPLGLLAIAHAHAGNVRNARQSLLAMEAVRGSPRPGSSPGGGEKGLEAISHYAVALARAWVAVSEGRGRTAAASALRAASTRVGERGERLNEAWLLHESNCLGQVQPADGLRLRVLHQEIGGELVPLWAAQATAVDALDSDAVARVADELLALGAVRDAVHASWSGWRIAIGTGDERQANVALAHLRSIADLTDWGPAFRPPPIEMSALTPRELHVAQRAAEGLTSKEIAQALSLSTRTVDNNLQRVYAKLGVSGRRELRRLRLTDANVR